MKERLPTFLYTYWVGFFTVVVACFAALGYLGYEYQLLNTRFVQLQERFATTTEQYEAKLASKQEEIANLNEQLSAEEQRVDNLNDELDEARDELDEATDKVDELEKIRDLDPELLKKYSKVYFLNENYQPSGLTEIPDEYTYGDKLEYYHEKAWPFLKRLMDAAREDDIELQIASAYRSFDHQHALKSEYDITYGEGTANEFSAYQGYSEHQLGTTADFSTPAINGALDQRFANTEAFAWLKENAHRFGFVLSYPENNSYYTFEPWHWRFVGTELARKLHNEDKHFYDMSQQKIDQYLLDIFEG
jgi:D-alanyl-D-alanine carboxypeptidase